MSGSETLILPVATAVANNGTMTVPYPAGTNQAYFTGANASASGAVVLDDNDVYLESAGEIGLAYGLTNITLTNSTGRTWQVGVGLRISLGYADPEVVTVIQQPVVADLAGTATTADVVAKVNTLLSTLRAAKIISAA